MSFIQRELNRIWECLAAIPIQRSICGAIRRSVSACPNSDSTQDGGEIFSDWRASVKNPCEPPEHGMRP